jgi:hypothetical protein
MISLINAFIIVALLAAYSDAQWVQTFPSYLENGYMPYWRVNTLTSGMTISNASFIVVASTLPTIAGASQRDHIDVASFNPVTGSRLNASTTDIFSVIGSAPAARSASPGAANSGDGPLLAGYWTPPGTNTTDYGVLNIGSTSLIPELQQSLVTGKMTSFSQPLPQERAQGVLVSSTGVRYVMTKSDTDVWVRVYQTQAAFIANATTTSKSLGIQNVSDVTSVALDEARNRLWIFCQTSSSVSNNNGPPITTFQPVITRVSLPDLAAQSIGLPRGAGNFPYGNQPPLLTILPSSGDVVLYTQTTEDCGRACTAQQAALVSRLDLTTGALKWQKKFPVDKVGNLVSDRTGASVLMDWVALNALNGESLAGLPMLISSPNPFKSSNSSGNGTLVRRQQSPTVQQIIRDPSLDNSWYFTSSNDASAAVNAPLNYLSVGRVQLNGNLTALPFVPTVRPTTSTRTTTGTATPTMTQTATMTQSLTATATSTTIVATTTSGGGRVVYGMLTLMALLI